MVCLIRWYISYHPMFRYDLITGTYVPSHTGTVPSYISPPSDLWTVVYLLMRSHVLVRKYVDVRMIFSTGDDMLLHTYKHFTANSTSVSMYVKPIKRACTRTGQRTYVVQEVEWMRVVSRTICLTMIYTAEPSKCS